MTAKEKAFEIFDKYQFASIYFSDKSEGSYKNAKACSKICVDIILNEYNCLIQTKAHENYWNAVKQEIEKL